MTTHFFTGFPGFIATELIKQLIQRKDTDQIYVLVKREQSDYARKRIHQLMKQFHVDIPIEIKIGDITQPLLGLSDHARAQLNDKRLTVWHLAAIYDLAVKKKLAWQVNVEGTNYVNEFVKAHPAIERYMYFSTAFVGGNREGVLLETELIRPPSFKNHYEETKFEAEVLVRELIGQLPVTIVRPGIVRGHSVTGKTVKFDGPYFFMNAIERLRWLPVIPYIGKTNAKINVVPIDYLIDASIYLSSLKEAEGKTVHLTDPNPHPVEEIYRAMVLALTGKKPKGHIPSKLAEILLQPLFIQRRLGVEVETLDYLTWNGTFDTTVAEQLLKESGITCVDFLATIPSMAQFYKTNKDRPEFHIKIGT